VTGSLLKMLFCICKVKNNLPLYASKLVKLN
jgi:hypothetical protein